MKFLASAGALLGGIVVASSAAGAGPVPLPDSDLDRITAAQSLLRTTGGFQPSLTGPLNPPQPDPELPPVGGGGGGGLQLAPVGPDGGLVFGDGDSTFVIGMPTGPEGAQGTISVNIVPSPTGTSGIASVRVTSEGGDTVTSGGITGFSSFRGSR